MKLNNVFIVDNSKEDRSELKKVLKSTDFEVSTYEAANIKEAMILLFEIEESLKSSEENYLPALIFLDVNMPLIKESNFLEKREELKKNYPGFEIIVFMMFTSSTKNEIKSEVRSYNTVQGSLIKGRYGTNILSAKLKKHFAQRLSH